MEGMGDAVTWFLCGSGCSDWRVHPVYVCDDVCGDDGCRPPRRPTANAGDDNSVSLYWDVRAHHRLNAALGVCDGGSVPGGVQAASRRARGISRPVLGARLLLA